MCGARLASGNGSVKRMVELGKRPRHWAHEIMALETKEERKKALSKAPKEWHELIRAHARTIKNRR